jgi:hypothetical protein
MDAFANNNLTKLYITASEHIHFPSVIITPSLVFHLPY